MCGKHCQQIYLQNCICVCIYIYKYITCECIHRNMHLYMHACISVNAYTVIYTCTCMQYTPVHACMHIVTPLAFDCAQVVPDGPIACKPMPPQQLCLTDYKHTHSPVPIMSHTEPCMPARTYLLLKQHELTDRSRDVIHTHTHLLTPNESTRRRCQRPSRRRACRSRQQTASQHRS